MISNLKKIKNKWILWGILAIGLVLLVLAVVHINGLSQSSKASFEESQTKVRSATNNLSATFGSAVGSGDKLNALKVYVGLIKDTQSKMCLAQDASLLALFSGESQRCNGARNSLGLVLESAKDMFRSMNEEVTLSGVLPNVTDGTNKDKFQAWLKATNDIEATQVSSNLESVKTKLFTALQSHSNAWSELVDADEEQNAVKFEESKQNQSDSYKLMESVLSDLVVLAEFLQSDLNEKLNIYYDS